MGVRAAFPLVNVAMALLNLFRHPMDFWQAGDPVEAALLAHLVEDRAAGTASYVEFLCDVHRRIQNKGSKD